MTNNEAFARAYTLRHGHRPLVVAVAALLLLALTGCPAERRPDPSENTPASPATQAAGDDSERVERTVAPVRGAAEEGSAETEVEDSAPIGPPTASPAELIPGEGTLYAVFRTNQGDMVVRLFEEEAPVTVANFVGLATGQVRFENPMTGGTEKGRFYDGTVFHRVIPDFMIQGGDPTGTGRGGPGYRFDDERQALTFDRPGLLAMANAGPNTNGSQFFITEPPTPHLDGRHTIFGTVERGMEVARSIARVPATQTRPNEPVVIERLEIVRAATPPTP